MKDLHLPCENSGNQYPDGRTYERGLIACRNGKCKEKKQSCIFKFYGKNSLFILPFHGPVKKNFVVHSLLNTSLGIGA